MSHSISANVSVSHTFTGPPIDVKITQSHKVASASSGKDSQVNTSVSSTNGKTSVGADSGKVSVDTNGDEGSLTLALNDHNSLSFSTSGSATYTHTSGKNSTSVSAKPDPGTTSTLVTDGQAIYQAGSSAVKAIGNGIRVVGNAIGDVVKSPVAESVGEDLDAAANLAAELIA